MDKIKKTCPIIELLYVRIVLSRVIFVKQKAKVYFTEFFVFGFNSFTSMIYWFLKVPNYGLSSKPKTRFIDFSVFLDFILEFFQPLAPRDIARSPTNIYDGELSNNS